MLNLINTAEEIALLISDIRTDGGTQPRAGIDPTVVDEYAEVYTADPLRMPPVAVTYDGSDYWLTDGYHRIAAAQRADLARVRVIVTPGTKEDAQWTSYAANATHGLRRTTADKQRAIRAALRHANAAALSNSAIAAHLGVSDKTVAKARDAMERTAEIAKSTTRTGADGRTINTANIGPKPSPAPAAPRQFVGGILASPDEVADAIDRHIQFRGDGAYKQTFNYLIAAKQPNTRERAEIKRTLQVNRYTLAEDYHGDLLLDGIRTLLQRTMQAEQDRITAEEDDDPGNPEPQLGPEPEPEPDPAPTSENPKSTGLPPLAMPGTKRTEAGDKVAIKLAVEAYAAASKHLDIYQQIAGYDARRRLWQALEDATNALIFHEIERVKEGRTRANLEAWRHGWDDDDDAHYATFATGVWLASDITRPRVAARMAAEMDDADLRAALEKRLEELA